MIDGPTPEQQRAVAEIGRQIVRLLGDEHNGLGDLQFVLYILASVAGHYLAGVGDEAIRNVVLEQFGDGVRANIEGGPWIAFSAATEARYGESCRQTILSDMASEPALRAHVEPAPTRRA